jgi:hypothetical protein
MNIVHLHLTHPGLVKQFGSHNRPRFEHVALASWIAGDSDPATLRREFPQMLEDFERVNGRIRRWYVGSQVFAAACLTERDEIVVTVGRNLPAGSDELVQLLRRCQEVAHTARRRLAPRERRSCQDLTFSVVEETLRLLDNPGGVHNAAAVGTVHQRLDKAHVFMLRRAMPSEGRFRAHMSALPLRRRG